MNITITVKTNYGVDRFYVTGDATEAVRSLTRRKTVDAADLRALKALGHEIVYEATTPRIVDNLKLEV